MFELQGFRVLGCGFSVCRVSGLLNLGALVEILTSYYVLILERLKRVQA